MKEARPEELSPRQTRLAVATEKATKNPVHQQSESPEVTREELDLRYKTETTVLKRILVFPLRV
jgi:hypothetical protein